ncbi:putative protein of unknown function (DUF1115) [Lyophyllum shimeji]|uniref:Small nuclear ribonucleoprotein Prp3 C-terminal domain-containing protein n=1 Tax=Lyophyllum shimeji TaxID=47721 RepID=A0A9P3USK3_LYOSH|nr:putative protein of unknown function (DUF1115) [Lyophyllum shimeji]
MDSFSLTKQLEELQLIRCSLLPDEVLLFLDDHDTWTNLVAAQTDAATISRDQRPTSAARVQVKVDAAKISFVVGIPLNYSGNIAEAAPMFTVKGDEISRLEHDRWQRVIEESLKEIGDTEYPIYQLLSSHLLPLVHEALELRGFQDPVGPTDATPVSPCPICHALLTSHHLISPNKRRSLQNWSASLSISGFAKVGYPGVIYAQGQKENVEEFVANIKAMQWLALKVRFVEELPDGETTIEEERRWKEFQKVGEVVEEMRRLGREQFIVEMGIGSAGTK